MLNSYLDLNFDILQAASGNRCANGKDIRLVSLGPNALFSNYKLTTKSGRHLEDVRQAHKVLLMYKLIIGGEDTNDLSVGFDKDQNRRQRELTTHKKIKRKNHLGFMLWDIFVLAENQKELLMDSVIN